MIMKTILFFLLISSAVFAQWPGYFYAFELKDSEGNAIDSISNDYRMKTIVCSECKDEIVMGIRICEDNKTWRYYAGGNYKYLGRTNMLKIEKVMNGNVVETMTIEFPAPLSGVEENYYRNLYAGELKFKKGTHKIKLPETDDEWNNLKEMKLCPDNINDYSFHDISKFQK